jgi:polysaccharide biosynthesis transport protein
MLQIRGQKSIALALLALAVLMSITLWFWNSVRADEPGGAGKVYAYLSIVQEKPLLPQTGKDPVQSDKDLEVIKRNRLTIIKSRANLHEVLRKDNIRGLKTIMDQSDAILWLEKVLELDYPHDGDILRIGISGSNPKDMAMIVNAVVDTYVQKERSNQRVQHANRFEKIVKELVKNEDKVRRQRAILDDFGKRLKTSNVSSSTASLPKQILAQEIQDCNRELRRLRLEKIAVQEKIVANPPEKEEVKESRSGFKQQLDGKLAILTQQEKYLVEEQKTIKDQIDNQPNGSLDLDFQQKELEQAEKTLILLRETKDRLELEGSMSLQDFWVQHAEVFTPK